MLYGIGNASDYLLQGRVVARIVPDPMYEVYSAVRKRARCSHSTAVNTAPSKYREGRGEQHPSITHVECRNIRRSLLRHPPDKPASHWSVAGKYGFFFEGDSERLLRWYRHCRLRPAPREPHSQSCEAVTRETWRQITSKNTSECFRSGDRRLTWSAGVLLASYSTPSGFICIDVC